MEGREPDAGSAYQLDGLGWLQFDRLCALFASFGDRGDVELVLSDL